MQTIKNGRKRGCGSCGQLESYESMQLDKPYITGLAGGGFGNVIPILHTAGRDIRQVRSVVELPMDKELAA